MDWSSARGSNRTRLRRTSWTRFHESCRLPNRGNLTIDHEKCVALLPLDGVPYCVTSRKAISYGGRGAVTGFNLESVLVAFQGAVVLIFVSRLFTGRRVRI